MHEDLLKRAKQNDSEAQFQVGGMYEQSPRNYKEAFKWYRKAAINGHAKAQNELAWLYLKGLGVQKNLKEALVWFRKAAVQGLHEAQQKVSEIDWDIEQIDDFPSWGDIYYIGSYCVHCMKITPKYCPKEESLEIVGDQDIPASVLETDTEIDPEFQYEYEYVWAPADYKICKECGNKSNYYECVLYAHKIDENKCVYILHKSFEPSTISGDGTPFCSKCHGCDFEKDQTKKIFKCCNNSCDYYKELCPECEGYLDVDDGYETCNKREKYFLVCSNYPECKYSKPLTETYIHPIPDDNEEF